MKKPQSAAPLPLTIFTSNATRAVLDVLAQLYEHGSGHSVAVQSDSALYFNMGSGLRQMTNRFKTQSDRCS